MTRVQACCFVLIASACVLAGLLMARLGSPLDTPARAEMILGSGNVTLMTATTEAGEESLFVLDGTRGRLLIYNINREQLDLQQSVPLTGFSERGGRGGVRR